MHGWRNPGAGARAEQALLRDPSRRDGAIAREAGCDRSTIIHVRARLEQRGVIEPARLLAYPARNQGAGQRALAELRANPARTPREVAQAACCEVSTVLRARRELESAAAQRAEAAWQAILMREPGHQLVPCQPPAYGGTPSDLPRGWPRESPAAIRLCLAYCPALAQCRTWAIAQPPSPGVLGGLTQRERLAARR